MKSDDGATKKGIQDRRKASTNANVEIANEMKQHFQMQYLKSVLEKPHEKRTLTEVGQVTEMLTKIQFFKDREIGLKGLNQLVRSFQIEVCEPKEEVIKYGSKGDKFYIILKGSVDVLIPNQKIVGWKQHRQQFLDNCEWKREIDEQYLAEKTCNMRKRLEHTLNIRENQSDIHSDWSPDKTTKNMDSKDSPDMTFSGMMDNSQSKSF